MVRTTTDRIEHMFVTLERFLGKVSGLGSAGNTANVFGHGTSMLYAEQSNNDHLRAHLMAQMSLWAGLFGDGEAALRVIAQAMSGMDGLEPRAAQPRAIAQRSAEEGPKLRALVVCDLAESYVASGERRLASSSQRFFLLESRWVSLGCSGALGRFGRNSNHRRMVRAVQELDERLLARFFGAVPKN
jgi:hypothetical protein